MLSANTTYLTKIAQSVKMQKLPMSITIAPLLNIAHVDDVIPSLVNNKRKPHPHE